MQSTSETICLGFYLKNSVIEIQNGFPCGNWNTNGIGVLQLRPFNIGESGKIELNEKKYIETDKNYSSYVLKKNDVIFNNTNSQSLVGKTALWKNDFKDIVLSNHMTIIRVNDDKLLNPAYLSFFLYKLWIDGYFFSICMRHVNQASVGIDRLKKIGIPNLSIDEQRKIAYVLTKIQDAIEKQEQIIKTTTELKNAVMHKLFTDGLKGESQKQSEIGLIPHSWDLKALSKAGEVIYGIQASVANNFNPIGTKILTNKNITLDGKLELSSVNYFELKTKRHFETILKKGDVLFNWRSGSKHHVGKSAFFDLDEEYTHSSFILRIRTNEKVINKFLYYYLNYLRETDYFIKLQTYSINAKFNKSAINNLPMVIPTMLEQKDICNIIGHIDKILDIRKLKREKLSSLFKSMLNQLMTGQIRVNNIDFGKLEY